MSKIRFLKVTTNYGQYIPKVIEKFPELIELPYDQALQRYFYDAYGWADFWKKNLENTGKFECGEIIMNHELLQKKWAKENNLTTTDNWQKEIVLEQIKAFKPDVLMLVDLYNDNSISANIKKIVPSIKLLLGWDGILWHKPATYQHCDAILTPVEASVTFYKQHQKVVYYHKFGFEPQLLNRLTNNTEKYSVSFTGSLIPHPDYHQSRLHMVAELSRKLKMNIWASSLPKNWNKYELKQLWYIVRHRQWQFGSDLHQVGKNNKGEVFGLDMFNVIYNSKIIFNTHGDNSPKQAANMRMTEVTGCGALLLTDWKENLHEFFVPDEEVVTFKSVEEAIDKTKMLLADENLRSKIALRGQQRTHKDYSYKVRMEQFAEFLYNYL